MLVWMVLRVEEDRGCYFDSVECDLNMRQYEWNTDTQEMALDRLKWIGIFRRTCIWKSDQTLKSINVIQMFIVVIFTIHL